MKFYQWYSQALGGIIGIASCVYCYLNSNLLTYSNLNGNFDIISFNGILASYTLYPLCFLNFIMAILLAIPNIAHKKIVRTEITKINSGIVYSTIIIGVLGCGIYFIIPSLLLSFKDLVCLYKYHKAKHNNNVSIVDKLKEAEIRNEHDKDENSSTQLLFTKTEMAIDLLNKNANINFIEEVTGLTKDYIINLSSKRE